MSRHRRFSVCAEYLDLVLAITLEIEIEPFLADFDRRKTSLTRRKNATRGTKGRKTLVGPTDDTWGPSY